MLTVDELWTSLQAGRSDLTNRSDFRFDPAVYVAFYEDIANSGMDPHDHYAIHGKFEHRFRNLYSSVKEDIPDLRPLLLELVHEPRLGVLLRRNVPEAEELAFELIALGDPIDKTVSGFSERHYRKTYPDIEAAGLNPLVHYLRFGSKEGRRTLADVRQSIVHGQQEFDPSRLTCMIGTHEFSRTGAPIVALNMARAAAEQYNVVVGGLRGGPLADEFAKTACLVFTAASPDDMVEMGEPAIDAITFAVLNSVECWPFARPLVSLEIPFANYVHEYAEYTRPAYKAIFAVLFSDVMVFSSDAVRESWSDIFADVAFDVERDSVLLPQADFVAGAVPRAEQLEARAHLSRILGVELGDRRLIYGAGEMQWRKGTDIFAMVAQSMRRHDPDAVMLWIGDGRNHEDISFGVWIEKHLKAAGADQQGSNFYTLPAGPYYKHVVAAADALFLSSRLDPLPNVTFDAAWHGVWTVTFEGATGFDDPIYDDVELLTKVPFGDIEAVCTALARLPRKIDGTVGDRPPAREVFSQITEALGDRLEKLSDRHSGEGAYDAAIMFGGDGEDAARGRRKERAKLWRYGRRYVWKSADEVRRELAQSDNWVHSSIEVEDWRVAELDDLPSFRVHIHAHYLDGLAEQLKQRPALRRAERIVVTTETDRKARQIEEIGAATGIRLDPRVVENKGRDILPFLRLLDGEDGGDGDTVWCHLHQKKSVGVTDTAETWRRFLLSVLLGEEEDGPGGSISCAGPIAGQGRVGLVAPLDPYMIGWTESRQLRSIVADRVPGPLPDRLVVFPVGNMFWTRTRVARRLLGFFPEDYPWPNEPIANDGTVFHLIERLWPAAAAAEGLTSVFVDKPGHRRA